MTDTADDDGPLSIDEAVDLMSPEEPPKADENPEAPRAETDEPADTPAEEEEPEDEAEADPEAEEEETAEDDTGDTGDAAEAPPAPASWSKEDQAVWAKLDPAARAVVARREADRDKATLDAVMSAGQFGAQLKQIDEQYKKYLPLFTDGFEARWAKTDWVDLARKLTPQEYNALRAEMDEERRQLADFKAKADEVSQTAYRQFLATEGSKLEQLAPEIAAPGEQRTKLVSFLTGQGFAPESLKQASAAELSIAYDAMRWREARANAKAKASEPKKKPPAAPAPKAVKAAPAGVAKSQDAEIGKLRQRVAQTRSIDDALDFLDARAKRVRKR